MRSQAVLLAVWFALLVPASADPPAPGPKSPRVVVAVSVDWEGTDLAERNLEAMREFRRALPDVPLTQFLNAAYFTRPGADAGAIAERIRSTVREGDELGLHVHCWKSLVDRAGVTFRPGPTFWGPKYPPTNHDGDLGHDVELAAYDVAEIRAIVRAARDTLEAAGFPLAASFRAGGWMASPGVLEAIRAEGFRVDASAGSTAWHDEVAGLPLVDRIRALWPGVTPATQPFRVETPAGALAEMPDTGALADYVTTAEMIEHLRDAARRAQQSGSDVHVSIGFHQETAAACAARVVEAVRAARADLAVPLVFDTLTGAAGRAGLLAPEEVRK